MQDTSSDKIDNYTKNTEKKGSDFVRYFFSKQMDPDWVSLSLTVSIIEKF